MCKRVHWYTNDRICDILLERVIAMSTKIKIYIRVDLGIPLIEMYPMEIKSQLQKS